MIEYPLQQTFFKYLLPQKILESKILYRIFFHVIQQYRFYFIITWFHVVFSKTNSYHLVHEFYNCRCVLTIAGTHHELLNKRSPEGTRITTTSTGTNHSTTTEASGASGTDQCPLQQSTEFHVPPLPSVAGASESHGTSRHAEVADSESREFLIILMVSTPGVWWKISAFQRLLRS